MFIGGVVIGFGPKALYLDKMLVVVAIIGVPQLVLSLWSIVATWADNLQYSSESASDNFELSAKFKELAQQAKIPQMTLTCAMPNSKVGMTHAVWQMLKKHLRQRKCDTLIGQGCDSFSVNAKAAK